jgi:hypothetical protein
MTYIDVIQPTQPCFLESCYGIYDYHAHLIFPSRKVIFLIIEEVKYTHTSYNFEGYKFY